MNAFEWKTAPRATTNDRKGTNKIVNLQRGRDYLGLRDVEIQPGSISIDPTPIDSRDKTARISTGAAI